MTLVVMATWAVGTLLAAAIAIYVVAANARRHEERVLSFPLSVEGSGRGAAQEVGRDDPLLHHGHHCVIGNYIPTYVKS